ncbi:MAG: ABC transporter ATP-binding protein [Kiloniellaceae bacterium]
MTAIGFTDITKRFGATTAVDAVNLEIAPGAFCSLVGPSGCGKTTLLRIAAGFVQPDGGTVRLNGAAVTNVPPNRRDVGFVFQSYALFPTQTVAQNIAFSLAIKRRPRREVAERVGALCEMMRLQGLEARYPHELSGGQQQRVALARALISQPSILLLDEPLSALDAKIRAHLRVEIRRVVDALGITAVYVTHDQEEALSISDRVAIMNEGRLLQVDTPLEVYLHPADRFVANFVGSMNNLPCRVIDAESVDVGGVAVPVRNPGNGAGSHGSNAPATLSVRPEHVTLTPPGNGGVPAVLSAISFLGQTVRLSLATLDDRQLAADVPTVDWIGQPLEPGAAVAWSARAGLATVFPGAPDGLSSDGATAP